MRRASRGFSGILLAFGLAACEDEPRGEATQRASSAATPHEPRAPSTAASGQAPERAPAEPPQERRVGRIVSVEGDGARVAGRPVAAGLPWEVKEAITTGASTVTVDLPNGARLVVYPGTSIVRTDLGPEAVAVGVGEVQAVLGAEGNSRRPPLRIATPAGELASATSVETVVHVAADGRSAAVVISGFAELVRGERSTEGRPVRVPVPPGRRVAFEDATIATLPTGLDAAEARARATPSRARRGAPVVPSVAEILPPLADGIEALVRRQSELDRVRRPQSGSGSVGVGPEQRERVRIAQDLVRDREALAVVVHRLAAAALVDRDAEALLVSEAAGRLRSLLDPLAVPGSGPTAAPPPARVRD